GPDSRIGLAERLRKGEGEIGFADPGTASKDHNPRHSRIVVASRTTSSSDNPAWSEIRMRLVSGGTVGGRIATALNPFRRRSSTLASARSGVPTTTGRIGPT